MKSIARWSIVLVVVVFAPPTWAQVGGAGGSAPTSDHAPAADRTPQTRLFRVLAEYVTTWLRLARRQASQPGRLSASR
jgi:hypothetical protein